MDFILVEHRYNAQKNQKNEHAEFDELYSYSIVALR